MDQSRNALELYRLLVAEVVELSKRQEGRDDQLNRRILVRSILSAVEVLVWLCRENVHSIALDIDDLLPTELAALMEVRVSVSDDGKITKHQQQLSVLASFRLASRITKRIGVGYEIDLSTTGWSNFKQSLKVRNRITHPKTSDELIINDDELAAVWDGYYWLGDEVVKMISSSVQALADHGNQISEIVDLLAAGDPATLALYERLRTEKDE